MVLNIVANAQLLKDKYTNEKNAPVSSVCIFSQSQEEYEEFKNLIKKFGRIINQTSWGNTYEVCIQTPAGMLRVLKLRIPDNSRPERGDANFTVSEFDVFKKKYSKYDGFRLIKYLDREIMEFKKDGAGYRVYFSNPQVDVKIHGEVDNGDNGRKLRQLKEEALNLGMELAGIARECKTINTSNYSGIHTRAMVTYGVVQVGDVIQFFLSDGYDFGGLLDAAKKLGEPEKFRKSTGSIRGHLHPGKNPKRKMERKVRWKRDMNDDEGHSFIHNGLLLLAHGDETFENKHVEINFCDPIPKGDFIIISGQVSILLKKEFIPILEKCGRELIRMTNKCK